PPLQGGTKGGSNVMKITEYHFSNILLLTHIILHLSSSKELVIVFLYPLLIQIGLHQLQQIVIKPGTRTPPPTPSPQAMRGLRCTS
ncbi:hypothetical protein OA07_14830, partial [Aphanizomenon flos-aquae 2012/KM1/D3]